MSYKYKMIQVAPNIEVSGAAKGNEAAVYLENIVNEMTSEGWEYYRVDPIGLTVRPGCLASLIGHRAYNVEYYVVTFRKEV